MLNLFKKKLAGKTLKLQISGMHCVSCSMNIDGELEDTPGVVSSTTSYQQAKTVVIFDEKVLTTQQIQSIIQALGYQTQEVTEE